jgi:hypothetical protein
MLTELRDGRAGTAIFPDDATWGDNPPIYPPQGTAAAVVRPQTAQQVAEALRLAAASGTPVAVRSGGHGSGRFDVEGGLVVELSNLRAIEVEGSTVRIGGGAIWGDVASELGRHGLALTSGDTKSVGVGGLTLGGGVGWFVRRYGLAFDSLVAAEVALPSGEVVTASADEHPDLFWALRGGGGNFGVVTAIEFAVQPVDELYAGAMFFPFERSSEVLHTWSELLPALPDELMSWASIMHFPPIPDVPAFARGRSFPVVMAAHLGDEAEGRALLRPLRDLGPARDTFATVPPVVLGDLAMDPLDPVPFHFTHQLLDGLPAETIDDLMAKVGPGSGRGPTVTILQFRHMGGALAREAPGAGARATLPGEVCMMALGAVFDEESDAAVTAALADVDTAVAPHRAGRYPNFVEAPADASSFFAPRVWARLREVKTLYDPTDLFAGNHHVAPAVPAEQT